MYSLRRGQEGGPVTASEKSQITTVNSVEQVEMSGFQLALVANILWGTSFLASKYTLQTWGPFTASALRFLLALPIMAIALPRLGFALQLPKKDELMGLALVGLTGFGFLYPLQLAGLTKISSGLSAAIMLTSPLFVIAFGHLLLKEAISARKIVALGLGLFGGLILLNIFGSNISLNGGDFVVGVGLTFAASVSLALSAIATKKIAHKVDAANLTFWSIALGLLVLVPLAAFESAKTGINLPTARSFLSLLYLAIICSALCFFIWNRAIARSTPKELATTMHVKTPTAVLLGVAIAGELLSAQLIIGTLIVAFGVYLSQSERKKVA